MKLNSYKRMHQLMEASIGIGMLGMVALSFVPKDAKAAEIPQVVVDFAVQSCTTQAGYNISRLNQKSVHDCATVIAVNIPKLQSVGKYGYSQWMRNARAQCHEEQDVYAEQYCLMVTTAISNYVNSK